MKSDADDDVSLEQLNAFVDGELDGCDVDRMLTAIQRDRDLAQRVCELRLAKDLVRRAYPPASGGGGKWRSETLRGSWRGLTAAAFVLVAVGVGGGWAGHEWQQSDGEDYSSLVRNAGAVTQVASTDRVLLHVSSSAPERVAAMLDETEGMLAAARRAGRPLAVEVLANSTGIDVLRADGSAAATRLAALHTEYPNLTLMACAQTIERLREKGVTVRLVPQAEVATSALDEVVKRIHEGWTYVRT
jgi:intracellular sulfur oxidation DsrE/DsrF family protein